jgi:8-oxo-dGTP pyrophosphatase MutT (NUDIX family)
MIHSLEAKISFELHPGSISRFLVNRWGERTVLNLNDTSHLLSVGQEVDRPGECEREVSRRILGQGRFLNLQLIRWVDRHGNERVWEVAERMGGTSAVMILAWLVPSDRLVLVKQYRPPAKAEVIEFPAGLVDAGESPEAAALRELYEETGFRGEVKSILKPAFNTPGMASEAAHPVLIEIDETRPENAKPIAAPAEGEDIQVILVDRERVGSFVIEQMEKGVSFDSKVVAYLAGLTS